MAGEVFLIVFVACFLKAHSQSYANLYPGQCKAYIQEQSRIQPTIKPEVADCISPFPKGISNLPNSVKNPCSDDSSQMRRQTVLSDLGVNLPFSASNNALNSYLLSKKSCSTNLETVNPICSDASSFPKRASQEPTPIGLSKATCPIENNVSPIILTDRSYYSCTSRPNIPNLVNVQQSPTVINDNVANTLAETLQLNFLNDLTESSLECNYSPLSPSFGFQTASSLSSANSIPTPFIPNCGIKLNPGPYFSYVGNNQLAQASVEPSVSVTTSINSLTSNNQVSSISSAAATSEKSTSKTEPARFGNACGSFKNSPAVSSNYFADSSTTIIDPQRVLNSYLTENNGIAPYSSATAISGVSNNVDSINSFNANYAFSNAKSSSIPYLQETCSIKPDIGKGSNSNFNGGLINVAPFPIATSETIPSYTPLSYTNQVGPLNIAKQIPCNNLQPRVSYPNIICSPADLYNSIVPSVDYGYSCPGPIGINPYGVPQQLNIATSSVAIAESNALDQSSVSISESINPNNDYSKDTSPVTSTVAIAESNDQTVSSVSFAKATTTVEQPCEIESNAISATNIVATNSISEVDLVATSIEPMPISTLSNGNALSSIAATVSSPALQGSLLETPVVLAVEIPSNIPSSAVANRFYGGTTSTANRREPLMYELQIPSSIPAQLSCNLGFVECEPVLCVNVDPVNIGFC